MIDSTRLTTTVLEVGPAHMSRPRGAGAERAAREVLSLPLYPQMTDEMVQTVIQKTMYATKQD